MDGIRDILEPRWDGIMGPDLSMLGGGILRDALTKPARISLPPEGQAASHLCLSYLPLEILLNWDCYYTLPFSLPAPTTRPGTVALYLYLGFAGLETQHLDSFSQEAIAVRNIPLPLLFHLPQLVDL